jgi:hypothetical protein
MPGDLEKLKKQIEDGMRAAEELQQLLAEEKREQRPKLRLLKGGLLGGAIWAGVEWFRDYKRAAMALAATGMAVSGAVLVEQPDSPGADPPSQSIARPPSKAEPSKRPTTRPTVAPRRTSPPRTTQPLARIAPPVSTSATPRLLQAAPSPAAVKPPATKSPAPKPTVTPTVTPPVTVTPTVPCVIDLLGIRLCLGR